MFKIYAYKSVVNSNLIITFPKMYYNMNENKWVTLSVNAKYGIWNFLNEDASFRFNYVRLNEMYEENFIFNV